MSEGAQWIDEIMRPLSGRNLGADIYNPIYSAVSRGTPGQGKALVEAIVRACEKSVPLLDRRITR